MLGFREPVLLVLLLSSIFWLGVSYYKLQRIEEVVVRLEEIANTSDVYRSKVEHMEYEIKVIQDLLQQHIPRPRSP